MDASGGVERQWPVHRKLDIVMERLSRTCWCYADEPLSESIRGFAVDVDGWQAGKVPHPPKSPTKGLAVMTFGALRIALERPVIPMMEWVVRAEISGRWRFGDRGLGDETIGPQH